MTYSYLWVGAITPLPTYWSSVFLALTRRYHAHTGECPTKWDICHRAWLIMGQLIMNVFTTVSLHNSYTFAVAVPFIYIPDLNFRLSARPSADTILTITLDMFGSESWAINDFALHFHWSRGVHWYSYLTSLDVESHSSHAVTASQCINYVCTDCVSSVLRGTSPWQSQWVLTRNHIISVNTHWIRVCKSRVYPTTWSKLKFHIEAETKWLPITWHFQMHFLEWKYINFN